MPQNAATSSEKTDFANMPGYRPGESDTRPWGLWEVLETGHENDEEFCIKRITVNPGGVLSLQSHKYRREEWTVLQGTLEVTRDDEIINVPAGETIHIPLGAKHRMANRTDTPVVVKEIQRGICREDDIIRYEDIYGRQ
ncbi:MAG TPA: phosphomannose isomerase type II C-terminal cupin domain [Alphaproteobacteria bacterium]